MEENKTEPSKVKKWFLGLPEDEQKIWLENLNWKFIFFIIKLKLSGIKKEKQTF